MLQVFSWLKRPIPWLIATLLSVPLSAAPYVYVCNNGSNTVSVIDLETNTISGNPITVGTAPFGIAVLPDGSRAYVTNQESVSVSVIDTGSRTVIQTIDMTSDGDPTYPVGIAVTPDGKKVYVCNFYAEDIDQNQSWIGVINVETGVLEKRIYGTYGAPGGIALVGPWGIAVSPTDSQAYICDYWNASVVVLNTETDTLATLIYVNDPSDIGPENVAFAPDGRYAFVSGHKNSAVAIVATSDHSVSQVPVYNTGEGIICAADNETVYVSSTYNTPHNSEDIHRNTTDSNNLFITKILSGTTPQYPVVATGLNPQYIVLTSDGTKGIVTNYGTILPPKAMAKTIYDRGSVTVFDAATGDTLATITGVINPEGLALVTLAPPVSFTGKVSTDDEKTFLTADWTGAPSNYVQQYEIFAYNKKIATISSMALFRTRIYLHPHPFTKHIKRHYLHFLDQKYKIRAVYGTDSYSTFVPLVSSR